MHVYCKSVYTDIVIYNLIKLVYYIRRLSSSARRVFWAFCKANQYWHAELNFPPINRTYRASDETYTLR